MLNIELFFFQSLAGVSERMARNSEIDKLAAFSKDIEHIMR